jgi:hypothetical protein
MGKRIGGSTRVYGIAAQIILEKKSEVHSNTKMSKWALTNRRVLNKLLEEYVQLCNDCSELRKGYLMEDIDSAIMKKVEQKVLSDYGLNERNYSYHKIFISQFKIDPRFSNLIEDVKICMPYRQRNMQAVINCILNELVIKRVEKEYLVALSVVAL